MKEFWNKLKITFLLYRINKEIKKLFTRTMKRKDLNATYREACNIFCGIQTLLGPAILIFKDPTTHKPTYLLNVNLKEDEINDYLRIAKTYIYNDLIVDEGKKVWIVKP